jgi:hypothetical protein
LVSVETGFSGALDPPFAPIQASGMAPHFTPAGREVIAGHMVEIVQTMQDDYGPTSSAVALASSVLDKLGSTG